MKKDYFIIPVVLVLFGCSKSDESISEQMSSDLSGTYLAESTVSLSKKDIPTEYHFTVTGRGGTIRADWSNNSNGKGTVQARVNRETLQDVVLTFEGSMNGVPNSTGCTGLYKGNGTIERRDDKPTGFALTLVAESQNPSPTREQCGDIGSNLVIVLHRLK